MPKSALDLLENVSEAQEKISNLSDFVESSDDELLNLLNKIKNLISS